MNSRNALSVLLLTSPGELVGLLFSRRARHAVQGLILLRRTYEYVSVMAALEDEHPVCRPYYEGYVDALDILGARAWLVASAL
jgi:hypothetical protein